MTIAAVGVARELVGQVRGRLLRRFAGTPMKWKHGKLTGLAIVTDLIAAYYLPVAVSHLHHDDLGRWTRFFEEAEEFSKTAEQRSGERLPQGDTILRMRFLCGGFADLIARILGARHPWDDSGAEIEIELLADTDLRGEEDRKLFCQWLVDWGKTSRLITELGVHPLVAARCQTEQEEPLLLLPDYIAGVYQHADPRTRLGMPVVTSEEASAAVHALRQRLGSRLFENPEDFAEEYPLK